MNNIDFIVNEFKNAYSKEDFEHLKNKIKYLNEVVKSANIKSEDQKAVLYSLCNEYLNKMIISIEIQNYYYIDKKIKTKARIFSLSRGEYIQEKLIDFNILICC